MISGAIKASLAAAAAFGALLAFQLPTQANSVAESTYAAVGAETSVPYGWVDFCQRYEGECDGERLIPLDVNLSAKAMKEIVKINSWVNGHVAPLSDPDHWKLADRWDYPIDGRGDCEDYALLKRQLLIETGFPRQALLMTVVKDENQEGHAILTVKTNKGEFVLDNLNDEVKPWTTTGYRFVKRQSQQDPNVWVQIGEPVEAANTARF
jgi:predicted transglutaminase-like cysteine proteinase